MDLDTDAKKNCVAGVDIGGTNTQIGIVDEADNIISRGHIPTEGEITEYLTRLNDKILEMEREVGISAGSLPVGIAVPCANSVTGCIEGATDLPWKGNVAIIKLMKGISRRDVFIGNDANAAAMGEGRYGAARGLKNYIVITLGTGVGSGVVCDGRLLLGRRGLAGELGHVIVDPQGRKCSCGRRGCLQTLCGAGGVVRTMTELLETNTDVASELRGLSKEELTARRIAEAADAGDEAARECYRLTGEALGKACGNFAAFTDPEAFILFGGVARASHLMMPAIKRGFEENVLFLYDNVDIKVSALPDSDAAILGAAALVAES